MYHTFPASHATEKLLTYPLAKMTFLRSRESTIDSFAVPVLFAVDGALELRALLAGVPALEPALRAAGEDIAPTGCLLQSSQSGKYPRKIGTTLVKSVCAVFP